MERLSAWICVLTAVGIFVAAAFGPLGIDLVRFHMCHNAIVQYKGGDVVMIAVGVGLLGSGWLWWIWSGMAAAITSGLALFVIYTFVTVVLPQEYSRYPEGNVAKYMLLYFGITALATTLVGLSLNALMTVRPMVTTSWRIGTQWVLGVQAGLFLLMWLAQVVRASVNGLDGDAAEMPALFWLIRYLDLAFVIPLSFLTIVLLWNRQPLAGMLVPAIVGFTTCMLVAIAAMSLSLWLQHETGGSIPLAVMMCVLAIPSAVVWWKWIKTFAA
ncbi:MAG: hypothetical protein M9953_12170 [Thermomicrobiales bacterium]|nr:hypothetical protein [Thermomicrobiales bacterium]